MPLELLLAGLGVLLLGTAVVDMIMTVLRVDRRGGIVTRALASLLWRAFSGGGARRHAGPPSPTGIAITLGLMGTWAVLAVAGWYLLFLSDPDGVVQATTSAPAGAGQRLYFTLYTMSTLGMGDYVPAGLPMQIATGIASAFGFGMATLLITYLTGVVGAVSAKRELARAIWALGHSPQQIVRRSWNGHEFATLDEHLMALLPSLHGVVEQLQANPLIAYFKSSELVTAEVPAVAMLHEAMMIVESSEEEELHLPSLVTEPFHDAMDAFLHALPGASRDPEELDTPPWPRVEGLRAEGIPVRPLQDLVDNDEARFRRRRLGALLHHQGWAWEDFEPAVGSDE